MVIYEMIKPLKTIFYSAFIPTPGGLRRIEDIPRLSSKPKRKKRCAMDAAAVVVAQSAGIYDFSTAAGSGSISSFLSKNRRRENWPKGM